MKLLLSIILWVPIAGLHILFILLGVVFLYPLILIGRIPRIYQASPVRPQTYWEMAWRNPVSGFRYLVASPKDYKTYGAVVEPTPGGPRFQVRFNHHKLLSSLRCVWRYTDKHYGEFYFGWKLGHDPLDFGMSFPPICRWWATIGN